ncbi:thiol-disulfide oxidoreductase DCC family protein [Neptuniibacter sp. PT8_73]|uniref:thiol-disulfide oxidoreductase DCC family protein n=1 Tax=unclassified Neptuniibacter TaxID=2630693 RepID=UPI0039F6E7C8
MSDSQNKITVFYDGSCPRCVQDRKNYESKDPNASEMIEWLDITNKEKELLELGIDPHKALTELHIRDTDGTIYSELDAYRILMQRVPSYRLIGWFISLPLIRPLSSKLYHWLVTRRLRKAGRL